MDNFLCMLFCFILTFPWPSKSFFLGLHHFLFAVFFSVALQNMALAFSVHPLSWWATTFNNKILSQLQEVTHLNPHFLAVHLWVSSMVMFALLVIIVLKGVQNQAPVHQVENHHTEISFEMYTKFCILLLLDRSTHYMPAFICLISLCVSDP